MSKHQGRKSRAYAAGARDALDAINKSVDSLANSRYADKWTLAMFRHYFKIVKDDYPMPEPRGKGKIDG